MKVRMRTAAISGAAVLALLAVAEGFRRASETSIVEPSTQQIARATKPAQIAPLLELSVGKGGRPILVAGTINQAPARFLIDTGCSRTGIDERFRASLGDVVQRVLLETPAGILERDTFQSPVIYLGGMQVHSNEPVFCQNFMELGGAAGDDNIAGVIGMDILKDYVVQIDFDEGVVRLFDRLPTSEAELGSPEKLRMEAGIRPHLTGRCATQEHEFLVDTGASNISIAREVFASLAETGELNVGAGQRHATGGGEITAKTGLLKKLTLGDFSHTDVLCDNDTMSLLGLRYLSRFRLTFDFPHATVYFRPGKRFDRPDPRGLSGIRPVRSDGCFVVRAVNPSAPAFEAGICEGDRILEINGEDTTDMDMFRIGEILSSPPGQRIEFRLVRGGREIRAALITADRFRYR